MQYYWKEPTGTMHLALVLDETAKEIMVRDHTACGQPVEGMKLRYGSCFIAVDSPHYCERCRAMGDPDMVQVGHLLASLTDEQINEMLNGSGRDMPL